MPHFFPMFSFVVTIYDGWINNGWTNWSLYIFNRYDTNVFNLTEMLSNHSKHTIIMVSIIYYLSIISTTMLLYQQTDGVRTIIFDKWSDIWGPDANLIFTYERNIMSSFRLPLMHRYIYSKMNQDGRMASIQLNEGLDHKT